MIASRSGILLRIHEEVLRPVILETRAHVVQESKNQLVPHVLPLTKSSDLKGIHLAIVDDHIMFRQGLAAAISSIEHMEVSMENSKPLQSKVEVIYGVWTEKIFLSP